MSEAKESRMMPKEVSFRLDKTSLCSAVSCGQCLHYDSVANPAYSTVCSQLGIFKKGKPCARFTPNAKLIPLRSEKKLRIFANLIAGIGKEHLPLIASILNGERHSRRSNFHFGQVVFIKAYGGPGDDYISNYRKAYVVQVRKKYASVVGSKEWSGYVQLGSLLTIEQWHKKKALLIAQGRKKDPKYSSYTTAKVQLPSVLDDYIPPTIDQQYAGLKTGKSKKKIGKTSVVRRSVPLDKVIIK